jgi:predicted ferric reductase
MTAMTRTRAADGAAPQQAARTIPPLPRVWPLRASDVFAAVGAIALLILAMWVRHGGLLDLGSPAAWLTAAGQLTALYGTFGALLQLVLMSRSPWLDQLFGTDRLMRWHRWLGFATIWLLGGHVVFTTLGYALADGSSALEELWLLLTTDEWVLLAGISALLFAAVGITSVRIARQRLGYETWYFVHLYTYVAIALGFLHQLTVGADFKDDTVAAAFWVALYVATCGLLITFRFATPIRRNLRHRLRVANIVQEAPGVVSVYMTGRHLDELPVRAGQWFAWRFLAGDGWWRPHPYSISTAPNSDYLRITVKDLGDDSREIGALRLGTPVIFEGPYGAFTTAARTSARTLLIAGGIGITPIRSILEELPAGRDGDITVVVRARSWADVVFGRELARLAELKRARIEYVIGRRGSWGVPAAVLSAGHLEQLVPDIRSRDIYVCGPTPLVDRIRSAARRLGVPAAQVHAERFSY